MARIVLIGLLAAAAGCGSRTSGPGERPGAVSTPPAELDPYGDSPAYAGDPFAGFAEMVSIAVPGGIDFEADPIQHESRGAFSVQVAACSTPEAAAGLAHNLRGLLEQTVFIDLEDGYHKVRVGSFHNREQANTLQSSIRALGYPDAWVVER